MSEQIRAPFAVWTIGDNEYKLKLKTSEIERLERQYSIGNIMNPIINAGDGQIPSLVYMLDVIHAALQKFHHGYSRTDTADLYDDYLDEGGSQTELLKLITEIFKVSGFFPNKSRKGPTKNTPQK